MTVNKIFNGDTWRREPHAGLRRDRTFGSYAPQRLTDDPTGEGRSGTIGFARSHADRRQANRTGIDKATTAIVIHQQLADCFLGAVGRLRIEFNIRWHHFR